MLVVLAQISSPSSNLSFLFVAFLVTWAAFFAYAFFVNRRQREIQREIEELRRSVEEQGPGEQG